MAEPDQVKSMSKEEIENAIREMLPALGEVFSNISGKIVRIPSKTLDLSDMIDVVQRLDKWDKNSKLIPESDHEAKKESTNEFLNLFMEGFGEKPVSRPVDVYLAKEFHTFRNPSSTDFLSKTGYVAYRQALFHIIDKMFSEEKIAEVTTFLDTIPLEDRYGISQLSVKLLKHGAYMQKKQTKISGQLAEKYVSMYDDLGGLMEKQVRVLYGIRDILNGNPSNYPELKRMKLANLVNSLVTQPTYSIFLKPFNVTIRNAIAHKGSHHIQPISKSIRFIDNNREVRRTYSEFIRETKELMASVVILLLLQQGIVLAKLLLVKEYLDSEAKTK